MMRANKQDQRVSYCLLIFMQHGVALANGWTKAHFKDEKVAKLLNDHFVSVKVDIDELAGYELKNIYDIKYLPTMLVFNSQGQLLDRVEETLSPRKLLVLLEKHNAPENKVIIRHDFNTAPSQHMQKIQK